MKTLLGTLSLFLAVPAIAQTAPAADPHAGHKMPAQQDEKDCCAKMKAEGKECCCKDKAGKVHDMEQHQSGHDQGHDGHAGHAGHAS